MYPRPPGRTTKLQEKSPALKREHPALQIMKFSSLFLFLWVSFGPLGPGSTDLIDSESNKDPDPTH
jgi:hypothetical protein